MAFTLVFQWCPVYFWFTLSGLKDEWGLCCFNRICIITVNPFYFNPLPSGTGLFPNRGSFYTYRILSKSLRFLFAKASLFCVRAFLCFHLPTWKKRTLYNDENSDKKSLYLSREGHSTVYIMLKNAAPAISRGLVLCEVYADVWMATL